MSSEASQADIQMDKTALYREEVITDRRIGTVQKMVPIKADGSDDDSRDVFFTGQTQVMTPAGALPLNFELEGTTLEEAIDNFPEAAKQALDNTMQELREMQREQASRIVTPDQAGGGMGGMGGGGMGGPGGGIQMR